MNVQPQKRAEVVAVGPPTPLCPGVYAVPYIERVKTEMVVTNRKSKACLSDEPGFGAGYEAIFGRRPLPNETMCN